MRLKNLSAGIECLWSHNNPTVNTRTAACYLLFRMTMFMHFHCYKRAFSYTDEMNPDKSSIDSPVLNLNQSTAEVGNNDKQIKISRRVENEL